VHPSHAIRGRTSGLLNGKRIVVGVSGSIAAIEVPRIIRELIRHGAEVRAVMSGEAGRIISAEALEFATGHPPVVQLTGNVEHVTLLGPGEGRADLYLIAPATANTISKIAHGIDDTPVTSCASVALGGGVPLLIAPAMHSHMGQNPAVRENLEKLRSWGVGIIASTLTEGEEKLATPEEVTAAVLHRVVHGPWSGRSVIVVGGASRESIDSVRSLTNESTGASAVALANQAYYRGAEVHLWAGALQVSVPGWIPVERWRGVHDLLQLARRHRGELARAAAVIVPAALSDYTVERRPGKIPSREHATLTLTLERAPKVLPELRRLAPPPTRLVAFKLESGRTAAELEAAARELASEVGADWLVANDVATMGSPETNALVLPRGGERRWIRGPKAEFAGKLLDDIGQELANIAPALSPQRSRPRPPRRHRRGTGR
jgi:phosphopantothenoylcysteine decarboxylase / phosphopantothenate---cysteine ligase